MLILNMLFTKKGELVLTEERVTKEAGWKYLLLSLGAFLGLALEALHAYGWEPIV